MIRDHEGTRQPNVQAVRDLITRHHLGTVRGWFVRAFAIADGAGRRVTTVPFTRAFPGDVDQSKARATKP